MLYRRLCATRNFLWSTAISVIFGCVGIFGFDVWHGSRLAALPDHDYTAEITGLRKDGKVGEALALCGFVQSQAGMPNRDAIIAIGSEIEHDQAGWFGKSKRFLQGFCTGKINSSEEMMGTVVSDFLIIGDIRDLGQQGYNAATGHEVDRLVVALSSLGVVTSAASWMPEPAEPAVASADAGLSLLKGLRKINALTNRFASQTIALAQEALKAKKLGRFGELSERLGVLAKRAPLGTIGTAMKDVESLDDLKVITRSIEAAPKETITALTLENKLGVEWLKSANRVTSSAVGKVLRKGAQGVAATRPYIRGAKFFYRGRINEVRNALVDLFIDNPKARKFLLGGSVLALVGSLLFAYFSFTQFRAVFSKQQ